MNIRKGAAAIGFCSVLLLSNAYSASSLDCNGLMTKILKNEVSLDAKYGAFDPDFVKPSKQLQEIGNNILADQETKEKLLRHIDPRVGSVLTDVLDSDKNAHILFSGMEFVLDSLNVRAKVGGLGVVMTDFMDNLITYMRKIRPDSDVSVVLPALKGIPLDEDKLVKTIDIDMGKKGFFGNPLSEKVKIYKYDHPSGTSIYFADNPVLNRPLPTSINVTGSNGKKFILNFNMYTPEIPERIMDSMVTDIARKKITINSADDFLAEAAKRYRAKELVSGRLEWEDAYFFGLLNKSIKKANDEVINANFYLAQDNHTAIAAYLMGPDMATGLTGHNLGDAYHGLFWQDDWGYRRLPHPDFPQGVPAGDRESFDKLLGYLGIDFNDYVKYFEANGNGDLKMLGAVNYIEEHNLLAAMPVSQGYTQRIKGTVPFLEDNAMYGIENGQPLSAHAANLSDLRQISPTDFHDPTRFHADLPTRIKVLLQREGGLNYGADLTSSAGIKQVHDTKALLKKVYQEELGLEVNPDAPLHLSFGRIVDQKNLHATIEAMDATVDSGGQMIIVGTAGDSVGRDALKILKEKLATGKYDGKVVLLETFANKSYGSTLYGAADFLIVPSKYEPCGIVDLEGVWRGVTPIVPDVDGLVKTINSVKYHVDNSYDLAEHADKLKQAIEWTNKKWAEDKEYFMNMRIEGMKETFPVDTQYSHIFANLNAANLSKVMKKYNDLYKSGDISISQALNEAEYILSNISEDLANHYLDLLEITTKETDFENILLNRLR